jgi:hypothetical protein
VTEDVVEVIEDEGDICPRCRNRQAASDGEYCLRCGFNLLEGYMPGEL